MNILFIGGTEFVGRYMVEAALREKHQVTLFTRGESHPELFPDATKLRGNRDGHLDALKGKTWDVVVDTCGYTPSVVRQSVELLKGAAGRYVFVSTVSVYADEKKLTVVEDSPFKDTSRLNTEVVDRETYGPLKVRCEEVVQEHFPDTHLIVRPGFVIGPHDPTDRFTYWVRRFATEMAVLCPDAADQPMQLIDTRDLGNFTEQLIRDGATGAYTATGPADPVNFKQMLTTCQKGTGSKAEAVWVGYDFLNLNKVVPMQDLPLWMPPDYAPHQLLRIDCSKGIKAGLKYRPLEESVRDTLAWDKQRWGKSDIKAGMKREREVALLSEWQTHHTG